VPTAWRGTKCAFEHRWNQIIHCRFSRRGELLRNPITGIAGCCARAVHARPQFLRHRQPHAGGDLLGAFITGFIENNNYLGRPADLLVLKDGSMLISDDFNGAVYRVTYDGATVGR
jgi:hypothetical protein